MKFKTRYIFNNRKTRYAVDFGTCPFMYKTAEGSYTSDECASCYAARLINVYPGVKNKLEELDAADGADIALLPDFKADITKICGTKSRFIRFYSLADFGSGHEKDFIHAAADIMPVELFSKTLHTHYRDELGEVADHNNVHISLSLNKTWNDKYIEELWLYLVENDLASNCQLNYTFIGQEEVRRVPFITTYHTTRNDKLHLFEMFGHNRVCCGRDESGTKITKKNSGNHKGSCAKCMLCKLPAADADGLLLTKGRLEQLYAT